MQNVERHRYIFSVIVLAVSCARPQMPPLPEIPLASFSPAIRTEVAKALDVARARPEDAAASGALAMLLHAHDRFDPARLCYRRAIALDPQAFEWPYYLAVLESSAGQPAAAGQAMEQASLLRPGYGPVRLRRAEIMAESGMLKESAELFTSIVRDESGSAVAWYGLGRAQAALGDSSTALESLRKAVAFYPRYGVAHYAIAQALNRQGKPEEARRHLALSERFKIFAPSSGDELMEKLSLLNLSAPGLIRRGTDAEAAGRLDESIRLHERAVETDAGSAQALANLIQLYARTGDAVRAETSYRKAIAANPDFADAHYNLGVLAFGQQRLPEAAAAFQKALRSNPYHAEAHASLGYLLESQGRQRQALEHYRKAVENDPGYRIGLFHLGRALTRLGDYAAAIAHLEKTLSPKDEYTPGCYYALGIAHGRAGHRQEAVAAMRKARELAAATGQEGLVASIERDLRILEGPR